MRQEAACDVTFARKRAAGTALLETSELIFRSPTFRLRIPFGAITRVRASNGALRVTYADGTATFHLGDRSAAWAGKIISPKSLLDKLGVKPEHRVWALKVRDAAFLADLKLRAPGVVTRPIHEADVIIYGAEREGDLARLAELRLHIKPAGMIWLVTPKGNGGVPEGAVMAAGKAAGLVDVKVAAFSRTHTASKFVIPKAQR
jgi:hypothetical protein